MWGVVWLFWVINDIKYLNWVEQYYIMGLDWGQFWDDKYFGNMVNCFWEYGKNIFGDMVKCFQGNSKMFLVLWLNIFFIVVIFVI